MFGENSVSRHYLLASLTSGTPRHLRRPQIPNPSIQATLKSTPDDILSALLSDRLFLRQAKDFLVPNDSTALVLCTGPAALFLAGVLITDASRLVTEVEPGQFAGAIDSTIKRVIVVTATLHDGDDPMHSWKSFLRSTALPNSMNVPVDVHCLVDARTDKWRPPDSQAIESRGIRSVTILLTAPK